MATEKITKAMVLDMILACESCAANADIVAYCENEKALLEKKAIKAKERAAAKRAEGDDLQGVIASLLTDEPQTAEQILAQIEDPNGDLTKQKIVARMSNLVKFGQASKCDIKVDVDGKSVSRKAYTLPVDAE